MATLALASHIALIARACTFADSSNPSPLATDCAVSSCNSRIRTSSVKVARADEASFEAREFRIVWNVSAELEVESTVHDRAVDESEEVRDSQADRVD